MLSEKIEINDYPEQFYSNEKIIDYIKKGLLTYDIFIDYICSKYINKDGKPLSRESLLLRPDKAMYYYDNIKHKLKHEYSELLIPKKYELINQFEMLKTIYYSRKMILYIMLIVFKEDEDENNENIDIQTPGKLISYITSEKEKTKHQTNLKVYFIIFFSLHYYHSYKQKLNIIQLIY